MLNQGISNLPIDFLQNRYHLGEYIDRQDRGFSILEGGVIQTKKKGPKRALAALEPEYYISNLALEQKKEADINTLI